MAAIPTSLCSKLDKILDSSTTELNIPSLYLGVTRPDGITYTNAAGFNVYNDSSSRKVTEDSVFWLCSQTKLITCMAALQLVSRGMLHLDTNVAEILPELANPVVLQSYSDDGVPVTSPAQTPITLRHLLNHSSGLSYELQSRDGPGGLSAPYTHTYGKDTAVEEFYKLSRGYAGDKQLLKFEPGTDFSYGHGIDSVGIIVERLTGLSLEEYFQKNIFQPLGIQASFYLSPEFQQRRIPLHFVPKNGVPELWNGQIAITEQDPAKVNMHFGGIGLYGSQNDFLAILRHILQILDGTAINPLLSVESTRSLFEPSLPESALDSVARTTAVLPGGISSQWSTGFRLTTIDWPGKRSKGTGSWGGYSIDPVDKVAIVFGSQIIPSGNEVLFKVYSQVEEIVYADLRKEKD